jgi:hypothetical protein
MILKNYLLFLEQHELGKGGVKTKPSPTFAWELVNKRKYPGWRRGRYPGKVEEKIWNGMGVDIHLENKWLNDLNKIKNVEIRGSCEGHDKEWVTYISFRVSPKYDKNESFLNKVCNNLNKHKFTVSGWDIGTQDRPRFVVASPLYYGCDKQYEWENWWNNIAKRIDKAVNG